MEALISVIVPEYKTEAYMDRCVQSIIEQTYRNIELILVDDGSPDRCPEMCDEWAKKDERIRVIHKENGGLSDARNAGLEIAKGEYIAFIDADDYVDERYLEKLYRALQENHANAVVCGIRIVNENDETAQQLPVTETDRQEIYTGREIVLREIRGNWVLVTAWGALLPRSVFETLRFPYKRINEDECTFPLIYDGMERVVCLPDNLYYYFRRSDSMTAAGYSIKDCTDNLDMWHARIDFYAIEERKEALPAVIQSFLAWDTLYLAVHAKEMQQKEKKLLKSDIKKYFWYVFRKPYLTNFTDSMKLAGKCLLVLADERILGKRYI